MYMKGNVIHWEIQYSTYVVYISQLCSDVVPCLAPPGPGLCSSSLPGWT
jgi:hypothetical protein